VYKDVKKMYCKNCGNQISKKDSYCTKCGKKVPALENKDQYSTMGIIALCMGIGGLFFSYSIFLVPVSITAMILSIIILSNQKDKTLMSYNFGVAGLISGIFGVLNSVVMILFFVFSFVFSFVFPFVMLIPFTILETM
jgi:branched-subunit amino acid transport protein